MINQSRNSSWEKYGNGYSKRNIQSTYVTFGNEIFLSETLESEAIEKDAIFPLAKRYVDDRENLRYQFSNVNKVLTARLIFYKI